MASTTYTRPYIGLSAPDPTYAVEPTDEDAVVLLRALAHYIDAYAERPADLSVRDLAEDLLRSIDLGPYTMRDVEWTRLHAMLLGSHKRTPPDPTACPTAIPGCAQEPAWF